MIIFSFYFRKMKMEDHPSLVAFYNRAPSLLPKYWTYHNDCCSQPHEQEHLINQKDPFHFEKLLEASLKWFLIPYQNRLDAIELDKTASKNYAQSWLDQFNQEEKSKEEKRKTSFLASKIIFIFNDHFRYSLFLFEDMTGKFLSVLFEPQVFCSAEKPTFLRIVKFEGPLTNQHTIEILADGPLVHKISDLKDIRKQHIGYYQLPSVEQIKITAEELDRQCGYINRRAQQALNFLK